ncbi:hypothetical protein [Frigidibacter sp. ROC022]|uniref:hypothetical protein n=1 Tax=Frigidibacter sp. ROC022 TaxID=2971796 RepID=UPI00215AF51A|nr:hypothetical protein [Frigidibacter sp. ROC022]MCR8725041.1 hypothetical protein [Frigidibacter sp. ROC022]
MSPPQRPGLALGPVLDRLAQESLALSARIERAEAALHEVLGGLNALPAGTADDLQGIDLVRQSLDDFARLLAAAAVAVPSGADLDPAAFRAAVQLSDLAERLRGGTAPNLTDPREQDELGLFHPPDRPGPGPES